MSTIFLNIALIKILTEIDALCIIIPGNWFIYRLTNNQFSIYLTNKYLEGIYNIYHYIDSIIQS